MKAFEYQKVRVILGPDPEQADRATAELNQYGAAGWELVSLERKTAVVDGGKSTVFCWHCFLKRELDQEPSLQGTPRGEPCTPAPLVEEAKRQKAKGG